MEDLKLWVLASLQNRDFVALALAVVLCAIARNIRRSAQPEIKTIRPAAQNRFRWEFYFSAENLKILLKKIFSSRKSKFPAEREMFSQRFRNSAENLKVQLENKFFPLKK